MRSPAKHRALAQRAHPLTALAVALAITLLAFLLPGPAGPVGLYGATLIMVALAGVGQAIRHALVLCVPLWFFLFMLHGVLGPGPTADIGPVAMSLEGTRLALAQAGRFGAIITISLGFYHSFDPSRFLNAAAARRWPPHLSYLLVATLQAIPAFLERASAVIEAQRTRGLRYRRGPIARARAVLPLTLPLILGALAEVDERTHALDMRGIAARTPRTALDPPADSIGDRLVRWSLGLIVLGVLAWRLRG